ncbi:MAG TPA: hypothetical protein VHB79_06840 [Polyangiaceae bacterium]|nr:hypothetical protein [Polyangiaceae bacterium]
MTSPLALGPIGQISRTVASVAASVDWYQSKLGRPHLVRESTLSS